MKMKLAAILTVMATTSFADTPEIQKVATTAMNAGGWRFDVTVSHPDTGWDHYAGGWVIVDSEGREIGMRVLAHPHETEQPFTRSLVVSGPLPQTVYITARCSVDGWAEQLFEVSLK